MTRVADMIGIPLRPVSRPFGSDTELGGRVALEVRDRKQLFLDDDFLVETAVNVRRFMHQPSKYVDNPIMQPETPWELGHFGINGGTVMLDDGLFRMWYRGSIGASTSTAPTAYATSTDGIHWERTRVGRVEFEGSKDNNLVLPIVVLDDWKCHGARVIKDPPERESDPARRYKMFVNVLRAGSGKPIAEIQPGVDPARWGFVVGFSPDGLDWKMHPEPVVIDYRNHYGGFNSVFYDDMLGRYVAYMQRRPRLHFRDPQYATARRYVSRMESEDFIHWTDPNYRVMGPDEDDPEGTDLFEPEPFQYDEAAYAYISMALWIDRYMDRVGTRLATSRDNLIWQWAGQRQPFIPHGESGSFDATMIHPTLLPALVVDDQILIYYSANGEYGMAEGKIAQVNRRRAVGLATLRLDGFFSLRAGFDWGEVTTWPLVFEGSVLEINVDAKRAIPPETHTYGVRVEILDPRGRVLEGFSGEDCDPIHVDSVRHRVRWNGNDDVSRFAGQPIKLRFLLSFAGLYAFQFKQRQ